MISSHAIVDSNAKIADDVVVGPFTTIGPEVEIDSGCRIDSHVVIKGPTRIGKNNHIYQFNSIGEDPQDVKFQGERTTLEIGDDNTIREFCTIHRGTGAGGGITKIGNNNLLLNYTHIAHDCIVQNHTIFANNASLAGHVLVEDYVVLGGFAAVYQFCRLGQHSFLASGSLVLKDVLPFIKVAASSDTYAKPFGLNGVGLRRRGFSAQTIRGLKWAYRVIFREGLTVSEAIDKLKPMVKEYPEVQCYIDFLQTTKHGILR